MTNLLDEMIKKAKEVQQNFYAPYSNYHVGCCLRSEHDYLFAGCNVENASYSLTLCAEASALGALISAGEKHIKEMVIIGSGKELCVPCGACRQRLLEFAIAPNIPIHLCNGEKICETVTLDKLLPKTFNTKHLEQNHDH
jgi:cytidine deaminase